MIRRLDQEGERRLARGETLWLRMTPETVQTENALGFSPIFWNTAWTWAQPPHILGILCDTDQLISRPAGSRDSKCCGR